MKTELTMESAAKIMGLKIRLGEPEDLTIAQLIRQRAELLSALETIAARAVDYPRSEMANLNAETARAAIYAVKGGI